jgi:hypothetical protein
MFKQKQVETARLLDELSADRARSRICCGEEDKRANDKYILRDTKSGWRHSSCLQFPSEALSAGALFRQKKPRGRAELMAD